ncbi:MAG TPA: hypothetical protein VFR67_27140 [Pilimelia sp.]|nr:hypothetical protein [Pilimelia sp.]
MRIALSRSENHHSEAIGHLADAQYDDKAARKLIGPLDKVGTTGRKIIAAAMTSSPLAGQYL